MMGDAGERQQLTMETSQWYEMLTGFTQSAANVQREYTETLKSASHCVSTETLPYSNSLQLSKLPKNLERYRSFIELYLEILIYHLLSFFLGHDKNKISLKMLYFCVFFKVGINTDLVKYIWLNPSLHFMAYFRRSGMLYNLCLHAHTQEMMPFP